MKSFHGIAVSPGVAMAKALVMPEDSRPVPRYEVLPEEEESQYERFLVAVRRATQDLVSLRDDGNRSDQERALLDAHLMMLQDPDFFGRMRHDLSEERLNVEWLLQSYAEELVGRIDSSGDEYLRERAADIHDVTQRVLDHLLHRDRLSLEDIREEVILVGHALLPSDAVMLNPRLVRGLALDLGGKTSHTAIIARSFGIPAVLGLRSASRETHSGDTVIIDGNAGVLIASPDQASTARYEATISQWRRHAADLDDLLSLPARTSDGRTVRIDANIEVASEVDAVISHGAEGIGLFRSEFIYLSSKGEPSEAEQLAVYLDVLRRMDGRPVTIRTFDLGGEKNIPGLSMRQEENPILGWRAIRYCLANPRLFKAQLRALLRASVHGDLRIMFPMISGLEELRMARAVLDEARAELIQDGLPVAQRVPLGIMIEIPSAALVSDLLAREVDFFSVGTNDLTQYTLAVDRSNERIAYLYEPMHLGVLRLLRRVIDSAHEARIPVGLCGEMAGDARSALVLLGMGIDELSMSPYSIAEVKRVVRGVSMAEAQRLAGELLAPETHESAARSLSEILGERFGITSAE